MAVSRLIGSALLFVGAAVAAISPFRTWGEFGPIGLGDTFILFRRYRGWDLPEGVALWSLALVAALVALAPIFKLPSFWRLRLGTSALVMAAATLTIGGQMSTAAEQRIAADIDASFGAGSGEFRAKDVKDRGGYSLALIGGVPMFLGSLLLLVDTVRRKDDGRLLPTGIPS